MASYFVRNQLLFFQFEPAILVNTIFFIPEIIQNSFLIFITGLIKNLKIKAFKILLK